MGKKKKGESKQSFLRRCVAEQRAAGASDVKAMSTCAGQWKAEMADADDDATRLTGGAITVQLAEGDASADAAARFAILAYTGKIIDWGWWRFIIDLKGIEAKSAFPALREHARDRVVGACTEWKVDANGMHVLGDFSRATPDAAEVLALCQEGFPMQASVGIRGLAIDYVEKGQTRKVNGITVDGPCEIWTKSVVQEVSFVSLGADDDTAAIVMAEQVDGADNPLTEDAMKMNKHLRALLVRMGLSKDATDEQALAFLKEMGPEGEELAARFTGNDGQQGGDAAQLAAPVDVDASVRAALKDESARRDGIKAFTRKLGLPVELGDEHEQKGTSLAAYKEIAMEKALAANPRLAGFESGTDESDKFRPLAAEGIYLRAGGKVEKPQDGAREFRGMSMIGLARLCLERAGKTVRGLSDAEVAKMIMQPNLRLTAPSVSDFASVFMDVANKRLLAAYNEAPATWRSWVNVVTASDFKTMYGISLSEAPTVALVNELGEYKETKLSDSQESYTVGKYGMIMGLSWEMIVNDDLRAFARLPQLMGASVRRKQADVIYALLTSNPTMNDNKALFHADRGNLEGTTKTAPTSASLSAARTAMRKFKGPKGAVLDIQPRTILIPLELETSTEILLRSAALPQADMSSGVHNPWANRLQPIAEPRLSANSATAWYVVGDPSQIDTIEVAFLDGREEPEVFEDEKFEVDAIRYKVRNVFGAGVMNWRGFYKNPGA
ncbi:phage major capsid protein [Nitratidesulfovibrio sp. 1201_IL3209]|uniref:phage major capsid protein n=1 Tax=Nitratidesulfovibrio sp. 1201_IL3209 TaxID=3084053 RepID=UPI002FD8CE29